MKSFELKDLVAPILRIIKDCAWYHWEECDGISTYGGYERKEKQLIAVTGYLQSLIPNEDIGLEYDPDNGTPTGLWVGSEYFKYDYAEYRAEYRKIHPGEPDPVQEAPKAEEEEEEMDIIIPMDFEPVNVDFRTDTSLDYHTAYNVLSVAHPTQDEMVLEVRCHWPEGTQEDYGYNSLVEAMLEAYAKEGGDIAVLRFPYGEDEVSEDAAAQVDVEVDIY